MRQSGSRSSPSVPIHRKISSSVEPYQEKGGFLFPLLSDAKLEVFKAYRLLDFDDQPMHGTFLVDAQGRIRFRDISDEPFNNPTFVLKEGKELLSVASARSRVNP